MTGEVWVARIYLADDRLSLDDAWSKFSSLYNKEDPGERVYGVYGVSNDPHNLKKKTSKTSDLASYDPILINYKREASVVEFKSKTFDFYQTGLSKEVDYGIRVYLGAKGKEVEI